MNSRMITNRAIFIRRKELAGMLKDVLGKRVSDVSFRNFELLTQYLDRHHESFRSRYCMSYYTLTSDGVGRDRKQQPSRKLTIQTRFV